MLQKDNGTPAMRLISDPIKEGAEGFLKVQYTAVARIASLVAVLIFASYYLRPSADEVTRAQPEPQAVRRHRRQGLWHRDRRSADTRHSL